MSLSDIAFLASLVMVAVAAFFAGRSSANTNDSSEEDVKAPISPDWTATERDALKGYLATVEGKKLIARLRATEYVTAVANAKDQFHTQHSAGETCGYSNCIKHLLSLSTCEIVEKDNSESGEARDVEPSLEERLSP